MDDDVDAFDCVEVAAAVEVITLTLIAGAPESGDCGIGEIGGRSLFASNLALNCTNSNVMSFHFNQKCII